MVKALNHTFKQTGQQFPFTNNLPQASQQVYPKNHLQHFKFTILKIIDEGNFFLLQNQKKKIHERKQPPLFCNKCKLILYTMSLSSKISDYFLLIQQIYPQEYSGLVTIKQRIKTFQINSGECPEVKPITGKSRL